jgi:uncharacterized protein YbjT (DUF2867 family)
MIYLVLGGTGLQGGAVVDALLERGASVRVLTRNIKYNKAKALALRGVELVEGDLSYLETLIPAFEGVTGVFSVQDFYAQGVGLIGEIVQGRNVIAAAKATGVRHIVQSAMGTGNATDGPPHFLSKAILERDVRRSGLDWTILGTVWFMDNLLNPAMLPHLIFPVLSGTLKPDTLFQMLAVSDLGWMAAEALINPRNWKNQKINLAGDVMTVAQMKHAYQHVTGRKPKEWVIPAVIFRRLVPEFAEQLSWHNRVNFSFNAEGFRKIKPNALSFQDFLKRIESPVM